MPIIGVGFSPFSRGLERIMSQYLDELPDSVLPRQDIRLVYFDIDGTLLDKSGAYPSSLLPAIERLHRLGIKTAVASGRPQFAAQFVIDELGLRAPGVFCTGAHIYAPDTATHLREAVLAAPLVERLLHALRATSVYYELYTKTHFYFERDTAPFIRETHAAHLKVAPTLAPLDGVVAQEPVVKLLIGADLQQDADLLQQLEQQFPECIFAYAHLPAYPQWLFASIIDRSACKKTAFDMLLNFHQLRAEQVMSFGDAQSDQVFLQAAGCGVAMGNASDAVKAVANYVTRPVWDHGIAYALSRLIPDAAM
jgi:5-amino-6-(5-phospho-D-ribitylamino)uracil phosphatase